MFQLNPETKMLDGQTDVGHTNLIGSLVTHNPPKNHTKILYFMILVIASISETKMCR